MFQIASKDQLEEIIKASERDAETSLFGSIIYRYAQQEKLKIYLVNGLFVGFIIEEIIPPEAELIQLFILSEYRESGFGRLCMSDWINSLVEREIKKVFLEVRHGNKSATNLYQKLGFEEVGRRKNYYQLNLGTFDAILMDKLL
jgi:ribosomal-protein-alanine N-acetyltransferase